MDSILSKDPDGAGYFYGFAEGDPRQINVRLEDISHGGITIPAWVYYVGGERRGVELSKGEAEWAAIKWIREHRE